MTRSSLTLAVAVIAVVVFAASAPAAEPQVAFTVDDGWLSLALTHDDQPVVNAQVQVYATEGHRFAEGETGAAGRGEFPIPPGPDFRVEIKVGDRWADPIRLTPVGDHVVPTNVLLSFGLTPCCRVPSRSGAWPSDPSATDSSPTSPGTLPVWAQAGGGVLFTVGGVAVLVLTRRRPTIPTYNHSRSTPDDRPN